MVRLELGRKSDFEFYYKLKCEKSSVYWSGFNDKPDRGELLEFWNSIVEGKDSTRRIYVLFEGPIPIGYVQTVFMAENIVDLSMGIVESARGKGYGARILRLAMDVNSKAESFCCYIREDNIASIKSFEKNGFVCSGRGYDQVYDSDNKSYRMLEYIKYRVLAIIPARSGSKGLKDKNIKLLRGKPLMVYTIEAAIMSNLFDKVHVSTDSKEYSDIAEKVGADQPFLRSINTSGDKSSSWDVVREVLSNYKSIGQEFKTCVVLQPTSPLRNSDDIRQAYQMFISKKAKTLTSVTEVDHPVQWCFKLGENNSMKEFASSPFRNVRRQELERHYRENGAIYILYTQDIMNPHFDFYSVTSIAYVMDKERSVDIDSLFDFAVTEAIINMETGYES